MPEALSKLTPDRDLQCFFFRPSAIAALSSASTGGFTVSGTWRQQFDWAVIEWNRDNVYEHPAFRYLPDGDLSGLVVSYEETRANAIPMDSGLFPTVDWPSLRIWATAAGVEDVYFVKLIDHATPIAGSFTSATATFTLSGTITVGDFIGLAFLDQHYTYQVLTGDTLTSVVQAIATIIDGSGFSALPVRATASGATITLSYTAGSDGNRFAMYSYSCSSSGGASTAAWDAVSRQFSGGTSPTKWRVDLNFSSLTGPGLIDPTVRPVPTNNVRKMRWTYAADLQPGDFVRSEFQVVVSNWTVSGTNRTYSIAGPGSRRIEDRDVAIAFGGTWAEGRGNYSGGSIHFSNTAGATVTLTYQAAQPHTLYLGTRYTNNGALLIVSVDGSAGSAPNLHIAAEDVLIRWPVGTYAAGSHTVVVTHAGPAGADFYFDFFELASLSMNLPDFPAQASLTAATDWDTDHSLALAPERTAWILNKLGFQGRANHYVGALLFYDLLSQGNVFAAATVTFSGTPAFSDTVTINTGGTSLVKLVHMGMTTAMLAVTFAEELNRGATGVWASASGGVLTIHARALGLAGNSITLSTSVTTTASLTATASGANFTGGVDGTWTTDLSASPRLNRAVRDWTTAYFAALHSYGLDGAAAFSMELGNGDPSVAAGIAQRGPAGDPVLLPTPSLQTNFSPTSLAFWREVYGEMAAIQAAAGLQPYLQFGEVQWWYFPTDNLPGGQNYHGMPFYDVWNLAQFAATSGHPLATILTNDVDPTTIPDEVAFLPLVIGNFTNAVMTFVRATHSTCRFEVLYPTDVNQTAFNQTINYPGAAWTPAALTCLKTESFGFTFGRDLNRAEATIDFGQSLGFAAAQRSQLVGVGDATAAWVKEAQIALGKRLESVVLFALDQFCLIGYAAPLPRSFRRSVRLGS
jgi:hypothetical protein